MTVRNGQKKTFILFIPRIAALCTHKSIIARKEWCRSAHSLQMGSTLRCKEMGNSAMHSKQRIEAQNERHEVQQLNEGLSAGLPFKHLHVNRPLDRPLEVCGCAELVIMNNQPLEMRPITMCAPLEHADAVMPIGLAAPASVVVAWA